MTTSRDELDATGAARTHAFIALVMLGVLAGTCLLLIGLAHSGPLEDWMRRAHWEGNRPKRQIPLYSFTGHFTDYEEWFLHEELPSLDYSRGGVYFLGASTVKWSLKPWDLPEEVRPLIHNLGFGGVGLHDEDDFLRFLVQDEGLLDVDPEKKLFLFGMNNHIIHNGKLPRQGRGEYFRQLWTRHGFYTVDADGTIHRSRMNDLTRRLVLEPSRMTGFLREFVGLAYLPFKSTHFNNPRYYNNVWVEALGPDWKELMDSELGYLKTSLAYLKQRKAKVGLILYPLGSWEKELPYHAAFVPKLREICDSEGVTIHDFTDLLEEEDFGDSEHFNPNGVEKVQRAVMGICLDHLRSTGVLPKIDGSKGP